MQRKVLEIRWMLHGDKNSNLLERYNETKFVHTKQQSLKINKAKLIKLIREIEKSKWTKLQDEPWAKPHILYKN